MIHERTWIFGMFMPEREANKLLKKIERLSKKKAGPKRPSMYIVEKNQLVEGVDSWDVQVRFRGYPAGVLLGRVVEVVKQEQR